VVVYFKKLIMEKNKTLLETKGEEEFLKMSFEDTNIARKLFGPRDENIKYLKKYFNVKASIRGNYLMLVGEKNEIENTGKVVQELHGIVKRGFIIGPSDIDHAIRYIAHTHSSIDELQKDQILIPPSKKAIVPKTKNQKIYVDAIRNHDMVIGIGPAGTGKTYLAMAMALSSFYKKEVSRIVLTRPAIEAGEKLGYLPGTLYEKVNPYLRPLYDALYDMVDMERASRLIEKGIIEIAPLAFMRGRTLNDAFIILDEAQNTGFEQMKMFLTRLGFSSKTVVTGDITQIDLPDKSLSGLVEIQTILKGIRGIKFVYFSEKDVVRHPLVQKIIKAYEARTTEKRALHNAERKG
ncbi:MAG TPA: PhoH family protein, partial [Syntrophorhabdaceae bacterium]|nr:PhoH family protein [Syntrophorhabdaceae bacterium]HOB69417.1 PhoH family protein [Syntrophorhabdaceae bacterium]HOF57700.1 PhoH family protein [Syntrophorhabdaceae bacterium]HOS05657.1 PhoH family protein [Syntrophorhabdaceae bacterium]HPH41542.1 PhoH family protein [Syntrophorhabdaceae bacterium]